MDTFPKLERLIEEIGFELESFDFDVHNDEGNREHVQVAKRALDALQGAVADLVP